jgi:hypothetical protein
VQIEAREPLLSRYKRKGLTFFRLTLDAMLLLGTFSFKGVGEEKIIQTKVVI